MIEIVNIEKKTYDKFVGQFEGFVKKMTEMGNRGTNKCLGDWLDNDDVCRILRISKRTLQTLRDNGTLAYSQISHKTYYRQEDVDNVVKEVKERKLLYGANLERFSRHKQATKIFNNKRFTEYGFTVQRE